MQPTSSHLHFLFLHRRLPVTLCCCRGRPVHWQVSLCSPARVRQQEPSGQQGEQVQQLCLVNSWAWSSTRWRERLERGPVRWPWWDGVGWWKHSINFRQQSQCHFYNIKPVKLYKVLCGCGMSSVKSEKYTSQFVLRDGIFNRKHGWYNRTCMHYVKCSIQCAYHYFLICLPWPPQMYGSCLNHLSTPLRTSHWIPTRWIFIITHHIKLFI